MLRIGEIPQVVRLRASEERGPRLSFGLYGKARSPLSWPVSAQEEFTVDREVDFESKRQPEVNRPELLTETLTGASRVNCGNMMLPSLVKL